MARLGGSSDCRWRWSFAGDGGMMEEGGEVRYLRVKGGEALGLEFGLGLGYLFGVDLFNAGWIFYLNYLLFKV